MLATHIAAVCLTQSVATAVAFALPVLAKKRFEATDLQTVLLTMASSVLFVTSIFWSALFARLPFGR